jgi:heptosyltransferase-3
MSAPPAVMTSLVTAQRRWFARVARGPVRVLVIQRDNIGDLVLVTPFLAALRSCLPDAYVTVLVNSYNAPVLDRNPHIDEILVYVKAKHRSAGMSIARLYWDRAQLWLALRQRRFELAVLMTGHFSRSSLRPALVAGAAHIAGYSDAGVAESRLDLPVDERQLTERHVVTRSAALLKTIIPAVTLAARWPGAMPSCQVIADPEARARVSARIFAVLPDRSARLVAIHISARKFDQRWPAERFVELMHRLERPLSCAFILLWAPGAASNPLHPGDDEKAQLILSQAAGLPIVACPTETLPELIAVLSLPSLLVCSDGGAMHLAAGQGCPIVALFGNSDPDIWHPWGGPYIALREPSEKAADISVERVVVACLELAGEPDVSDGPVSSDAAR